MIPHLARAKHVHVEATAVGGPWLHTLVDRSHCVGTNLVVGKHGKTVLEVKQRVRDGVNTGAITRGRARVGVLARHTQACDVHPSRVQECRAL